MDAAERYRAPEAYRVPSESSSDESDSDGELPPPTPPIDWTKVAFSDLIRASREKDVRTLERATSTSRADVWSAFEEHDFDYTRTFAALLPPPPPPERPWWARCDFEAFEAFRTKEREYTRAEMQFLYALVERAADAMPDLISEGEIVRAAKFAKTFYDNPPPPFL
tara:strand:+ start:314 stop:811 length:498 start_codon:yes stop_codon:yes gene_type:complete